MEREEYAGTDSMKPGNGVFVKWLEREIAFVFSSGDISFPKSTVTQVSPSGKIFGESAIRLSRSLFRIEILSQAIADKVESQDSERNRDAGKDQRVRCGL